MTQLYQGNIVSISKDAKTVGVKIVSYRQHPKYHRTIKIVKKKQVHNEGFPLQINDRVAIKSSRPYSTTKKFVVVEKIIK